MVDKEFLKEDNKINNKLKCQLITILLNKSNEFTNKYTTILSNKIDYDYLLEEYFVNKNMTSIKVDNHNQSLCFTNQKDAVLIYNPNEKKSEEYYEEVHIHCNDLYSFDEFIDYLYASDYCRAITEVDEIPHYESISKKDLNSYQLISAPLTNEIEETKKLLNILAERSDETIFRALAIHFKELVNDSSEIDIDLIHNLNDIYQYDVVNNEDVFFSTEINNKLLNIYNAENCYEKRISEIPSQKEFIYPNFLDE